jgi:hypothetical protein
VAFDLTSGGPWTTVAVLAQGDTAKAITEAENPARTTLTVSNGNGSATVTICASTLLTAGEYSLEIRTTNGTLSYTWPPWSLRVVEPVRI